MVKRKIVCPYCGSKQVVDVSSFASEDSISVICTECNNKFTVDKTESPTVSNRETNTTQDFVECPFCGAYYTLSPKLKNLLRNPKAKIKCKKCGKQFPPYPQDSLSGSSTLEQHEPRDTQSDLKNETDFRQVGPPPFPSQEQNVRSKSPNHWLPPALEIFISEQSGTTISDSEKYAIFKSPLKILLIRTSIVLVVSLVFIVIPVNMSFPMLRSGDTSATNSASNVLIPNFVAAFAYLSLFGLFLQWQAFRIFSVKIVPFRNLEYFVGILLAHLGTPQILFIKYYFFVRYFLPIFCVTLFLLWLFTWWRYSKIIISPQDLGVSVGIFFQDQIFISYDKIQSVSVRVGPIQRVFGLADLGIIIPGAGLVLVIKDIPMALYDFLCDKVGHNT